MIGTHVDDSIEIRSKDFVELRKLSKQCFESKPRKYDYMTFAGISITKKGKSYLLCQTPYASRPNELSLDCVLTSIVPGDMDLLG